MRCRRDEINPATGLYNDDCSCCECRERNRHRVVIESCEVSLARAIGYLLDEGLMPLDIADTVRRSTMKRSKAWMLTRIELTCQAGHWLSQPEWIPQLEQVDQLCKYTGFHVGTTIPGWMQRWFIDKAHGQLPVATDGVADVWLALADELERISMPDGDAVLGLEFIARYPSNVIAFPVRRS